VNVAEAGVGAGLLLITPPLSTSQGPPSATTTRRYRACDGSRRTRSIVPVPPRGQLRSGTADARPGRVHLARTGADPRQLRPVPS